MNWHCTEIPSVLASLEATEQGLSNKEASRRLDQYGPNVLQEAVKRPPWKIFLLQFKDFMILILVAAAIISGLLGEITDTIIILVIVILNAVVGFVQEFRAEKAIEALKKMAAFQANAWRDGSPVMIEAAELVPGDIVQLEAGNAVPADLRLLQVHSLQVDESALTGESVSVEKQITTLQGDDLPLGDRTNLAFKGTLVTHGRAIGVVVNTGMNTEIGHIARLLQEKETQTPLQKRMGDFGRKLSYLILLICVLLFGIGLLRGEDVWKMLLLSISLAVAAIPEALPALITIALARGAKRLVKKHALIRKLPAVETLGSVSYICSDKTGTLTLNKMTVVEAVEAQTEPFADNGIHKLQLAMALNHDVRKDETGKLLGDPTELAMVDYILQCDPDKDLDWYQSIAPREAEIPFDSDRKCMTTIHRIGNRLVVVSKGAIEAIFDRLDGGGRKTDQHIWIERAEDLAGGGMRVLAYAMREIEHLPQPFTYGAVEENLHLVGIVALMDPAREEVKAAIAECKTAGIKPVMITGDHLATAVAIGTQIGIKQAGDLAVTGLDLSRMPFEEFRQKVEHISVYARVSPEQKLNIVRGLQEKHHYVAMTGDGVNDAPSLKVANIGIAMGINGTDVSKEAAHMILLDDNFATIVKAVKEGRRIYDNIRKFVKYIMTCNGAEIWTIFLAPLVGLPMPLLPVHILWINLVTDGLPGLALASEGAEPDIMKRPPRPAGESLFAGGIGIHIAWVGVLMAGVTLGIQAWAIYAGNSHWQTMVFTVLSLAQLGHVLAIRSDRTYLFRLGLLTNMPLLGAVLLTFFLQLGVIYLPAANAIFKTSPLTAFELAMCIGASAIVFHAVELEKAVKQWKMSRNGD